MSLKPNKLKTIDFLVNKVAEKHPDLNIPKIGLFLGAGCSVDAGIPLASGVIDICKRKAFIHQYQGGHKHLNSDAEEKQFISDNQEKFDAYVIEREQALKNYIVEEHETFSDDEVQTEYYDSLYGFWFVEFSEDPEVRHRLIESIIENIEPKGPYIFLSYLIEKGYFKNIFTTNFDDLVNDAIIYYTSLRPRIYVSDDLSRYISFTSNKPNIIKLHGDFRYANIKNTMQETHELDDNYGLKLKEYLNKLDLMVVGYNGADKSIMNVLKEAKKFRPFGLYWCVKSSDEVHERVKQFINDTDNSFLVETDYFSPLIAKLYIELLPNTTRDKTIVEIAEERSKRHLAFQEQFIREISKGGSSKSIISDEDVKKLNQTVDVNKLFEEAYKLPDSESEKIVELYDKVIEISPDYWQAYYNRGSAKNYLGHYAEAIEDNKKTLKLNPNYAMAHNNYAVALERSGKHEEAIERYGLAIKTDPEFDLAYTNRGILRNTLQQYEEAIKDFNFLINKYPDVAKYYVNRGFSKTELQRHEEAIKDYDKAIELGSKDPYVFNNKGFSLVNLGKTEEGIKEYNNAITLDPNFVLAYHNRGHVKNELLDFEGALQDYKTAVEIDASIALSHNNKGLLNISLGNYTEALEDFNRVIELDDDFNLVYINRGVVKYNLRNYQNAIYDYDIAEKRHPNDGLVYYNRGLAYLKLEKYDNAKQDTEKALELMPDSYLPYTTMAQINAYTDNHEAFYSWFEKALKKGLIIKKEDVEDSIYLNYLKEERFKTLLKNYNIKL